MAGSFCIDINILRLVEMLCWYTTDMQRLFMKKNLPAFLFLCLISSTLITGILNFDLRPQVVHAEGEGDGEGTGSDADTDTGAVGDISDGTPTSIDGIPDIGEVILADLVTTSSTCLNNTKSVVISYNLYNLYTLYTDGATFCRASRVSMHGTNGTTKTAGCINSGSTFSGLSGAYNIVLEMQLNENVSNVMGTWVSRYFPLVNWDSFTDGLAPAGAYVPVQTKDINVDGAESPGSCTAPATPVINSVASGCTLPVGGGSCNISVSWTSSNTNSGLVDVMMLRPDGTNTGTSYVNQPANGSITISTSLPGNHVFGVYDHGTGFSTSGVYSSSNAMVNTQTAPPEPPSMGAYCNSGTSATITWGAAAGATTYYPRIAPISQSVCSSVNWLWLPDSGGTCYTNKWPYGTGVANFPVVAGQTYSAWVHSGDPVDWTKAKGTTFTCNDPVVNTYEATGYFDALSCSTMDGWAYDADSPGTAINVRVYWSTMYGGGWISGLLGTYNTNIYDASLNSAIGVSSGSHRFSIPVPAQLKDGKEYRLNIYAVDPATGQTKQLHLSPRSVTCTAKADLTVSGITPTSAVVGVPTTFSARVTNTGDGSTNIGFKNFYQIRKTTTLGAAPGGFFGWLVNIAKAATTETITDLGSITLNALGAGASGDVTQVYTFPDNTSAYAVRVCADKADRNGTNGDPNGEIAEADETNNCGGWTNINVTSTCGNTGAACEATNRCGMKNTGTIDSTCHCSVSAPADSLCPTDRVPYGYYDSTAAASCTSIAGWAIDPDTLDAPINVHMYSGTTFIGSYVTNQVRNDVNNNPGVNATGAHGFDIPTPAALKTGTPHVVHIYAINNNPSGNNAELNLSPKTVTCYPEPFLSLVPGATRVREGNPVDLNWYARNVTSCTLTGPDVSESQTATGGGNVGTSATPKKTTTNVSGQSTYTLTCRAQSDGKNRSVSATVTAIPVFIER